MAAPDVTPAPTSRIRRMQVTALVLLVMGGVVNYLILIKQPISGADLDETSAATQAQPIG